MGRFEELKGKKILILGTGKIAERVLEELNGFDVVGILDRNLFEGSLMGIPILTWDDLDDYTAEAIIIASLKKHYKEIYHRIQYYCSMFHITVYGENGLNLSCEYQFKDIGPQQEFYFHKNETELKKLIEQYDAISFDLFDTLVMRRTLEEEDIYILVEDRIRKKGIQISDFKKKRRTAALRSDRNQINKIYDNLKLATGISEKECSLVLREEIECERECLIPRVKMVELMAYAVRSGKHVSIIADTCLSAEVIKGYLTGLNIIGYDNIYSSSEYNIKKSDELFKIYRKDVGTMTCLHIGNNGFSDAAVLPKYKIDFYEIKSAYEMLKMSSLKKLLVCSDKVDNRVVLGFIAGEIFNNPFALYHTSGVVSVKTSEEFAVLFMVPIVLIYMQYLIKTILEKQTEMILFTARDGYLFKKIYDSCFMKATTIPSIYLLASRKLCLKSSMDSEEGFLSLCKGFSTDGELKYFLKEFLQEESLLALEKEQSTMGDFILFYKENLKRLSRKMRGNYLRYTEKMGIHMNQRYLFCELCSTGTVHEALNNIWNMDMDGFYLYKRAGIKKRFLHIASIYDDSNGYHIEQLRDLLEIVLTSDEPSVCAMDEKGEPVYSAEHRTNQELFTLKRVHEAIMEFVQKYVDLRGIDNTISKEFPDLALGIIDCVKFENEMNEFINRKNVDDMTQRQIAIFYE